MNMTTVPSDQLKEMQQQLADKDAEIAALKAATVGLQYTYEHVTRMQRDFYTQFAAQELVIQQLRDHIADSADTADIALRKAWQLGQTYWQQADSESYSQQDKSVGTQERFSKLVSDTCVEINQALAIPHSTKHHEAWYREMVGEPVAYMQISVEEGVDTKFPRDHLPKKYNKEWWKFEPLHTIKPFPFKGE